MNTLSNLSLCLSNPRISLNDKLLNICMTVKSEISTCDRVGVWLFSSDHSEMVSLMCVDESGIKTTGQKFSVDTNNNYFSHIINNELLVASDAKNNEISKCFNKEYFSLHDIHSILDVTFMKDFIPLGVICCERTVNKTEWKPLEIETLKSISTKTSLFISNHLSDIYPSESKDS